MKSLNLSPQQIIKWHKEQADYHAEIAASLEDKFGLQSTARFKRVVEVSPEGSSGGSNGAKITAEQLESAVRTRSGSGRIKDYADELRVDVDAIRKLLEPASRVYTAPRGWLKLRE